ncbi:MAG: dodecin domain-containing protein [Candidatus Aminicenantes bacterium]|nr:dodecin domain-containing protein [Candidatus Aminicenantes bacterium]
MKNPTPSLVFISRASASRTGGAEGSWAASSAATVRSTGGPPRLTTTVRILSSAFWTFMPASPVCLFARHPFPTMPFLTGLFNRQIHPALTGLGAGLHTDPLIIGPIPLSEETSMLKMIEVVGTSPSGFSEAVGEAVDRLLADGEKVHFFQVVEQRGSVREGKLREFQVVLKAAVEAR